MLKEIIREKFKILKLKKIRNLIYGGVIFLVTSIGIVITFIHHQDEIEKRVLERNMSQIEEISKRIKHSLNRDIEHAFHMLESIGEIIGEDYQHSEKILVSLESKGDFSFLGVADVDGEVRTIYGKKVKIEDPNFFKVIKSGERYVSDVLKTSNKDRRNIALAVPIYRGGKVVGALWGYYPISEAVKKTEQEGDTGQYFQIVDTNGIYISPSYNKNALSTGDEILWEEMLKYKYFHGKTVEGIRESLKRGESGQFLLQYKDRKRYINYEPLGINNWYIFSVLTQRKLNVNVEEIQSILQGFLVYLVFFIIFLTTLLLGLGNNIYRILKGKNSEIEAKNKIFRLLLHKTENITFEISLEKKNSGLTIQSYNKKDEEEFFPIETLCPENMLIKDYIKKGSYSLYKRIYQSILAGEEIENILIQLRRGDSWRWFYIYSIPISADKIIGILEDCTEEREKDIEMVKISEKSKYDFLTGLYNRENFQLEVEKVLKVREERGVKALFIIDLDNFKKANDTFGHIVGDRILQEISTALKANIRKGDFAGRLGGDEFVLFVKNLPDVESLKIVAERLNSCIVKTYTIEGESVTISASIGIAVAKESLSFKELYTLADKGLYCVKAEGKNSYFIVE